MPCIASGCWISLRHSIIRVAVARPGLDLSVRQAGRQADVPRGADVNAGALRYIIGWFYLKYQSFDD
jgi:hypothetical protein